jgi:lipoprotein-releasing system permease protein
MKLLIIIALRHLLARKRQSIVSLLGIILGVAFFLAISALMQGSENDFMKRLVDNSPHITISDEFRDPRTQPVWQVYEGGAIDLRGIKPVTETRGLRGYKQILSYLRTLSGLRASPVLAGQVIVSFAGQDSSLSLSGMIPAEIATVSTIQNYMVQGKVENLIANPNGVIIGAQMAKRFSLDMGDNLTVTLSGRHCQSLQDCWYFQNRTRSL